ncbi:early transcribed membrane protein [Plasmodium ovale]|uniref:Early transcribed membrane protein n=1 Tax=Plasmodium ovale TaxID=36330 RepID=A0A1C3KWR2_PLAOA|nr:early transcribed membrane protein [Plasmodium ovale]
MRVTKACFLVLFLLLSILLEPHLSNDLAEKNKMLLTLSEKSLRERKRKKAIIAVAGTVAAILAIAIAGIGIHRLKRKRLSIWDDLGSDADTILNNAIAHGIWNAKKKFKKEVVNIDRLLPSIGEIKELVREEFNYKNLDMNKFDQKQIEELCNFTLYSVRQSMLSFQRNVNFYS